MINRYSMYDKALVADSGASVYQQELTIADKDDANWFSDAFNDMGNESDIGDKIVEQIQNSSNDLKLKRDKLDEQFKSGTATDSFSSMVSTAREISDYGFKTSLVAKVISKSTQSIEKLTNLQ